MPLVGLRKLYYAKLTKDDATGVTYSSPVKLANAIELNITPNSESTTLFADDGPIATASAMGEIEVEINVDDLPSDVLVDLLGITKDANGVLKFTENFNTPYIALGFSGTKHNGEERLVWLTKGQMNLPEESYKTKEGTVEFQTKTISTKFVKREKDGVWKYQVDTDDAGIGATVKANWFTAVYNGS